MAGPHIKFVADHEDQISQHKYHILQGKHNLAPFQYISVFSSSIVVRVFEKVKFSSS